MKARFLRFLPEILILAGPACHVRPAASTSVYILNQSRDTLDMNGKAVEYWMSHRFYVSNGDTYRVSLARRGTRLGVIAIASLMAAGDPGDYDAAINVHEDTLNKLRIGEYSPYIDAKLESLP